MSDATLLTNAWIIGCIVGASSVSLLWLIVRRGRNKGAW